MIRPLARLRTVGQLLALRRDPLGTLMQAQSFGPVVPLQLEPFDVVAIFDAGVAHHVLHDPDAYTKGTRVQRVMRTLLGNGLLTAQGAEWRARRRLAQPAFRKPRLAAYTQIMHDVSRQFADRWRATTDPLDLNREMMRLALQIASRCLFDDQLEGQAEDLDQAMGRILASFQRMVTQPVARPEAIPFGPAATYRRAISEIDAIVADLVARRRARGSDGDDLLHLWLHSDLDDEAIRDEVVTMLLAAHETTANALTWAWLHLLRYPDALRAIRDEVAELGGPEGVLELSPRAGALPWTDAVVAETLRLYPPAWATGRSCAAAGELHPEGHSSVPVRQGTVLLMCFYAMHRSPRAWTHPEGFDPGRWLRAPSSGGVKGLTLPELPYVPFGTGQRKCIGSHFATLEARIALATLASSVDLALEPAQQISTAPAITLRPDGPVWARVSDPQTHHQMAR
ncbi:MAG: cytochrome P450 [Myxococcales bacterium]|nr:cytochrome P450 [Myxococcales bacterium]